MTDAPRSSVAAASLAFGVWVATACALGLDFGRTARLPAAEPLPPAASQESQLDSHESAGEAANQRPLHFVNDVIPLLTKLGCNSGACHGRGTGQNGFKLSLFGFDSDADYAALVEEGEGRRISWTAPDESLILQKATGKVPHGGGVRLKADSGAYRLLRQWIAEGTPRGDQNAPTLTAIEVKPAERAIAPNETQQLEVIACYSDKSTRNITPTAEYFSQQPELLQVSPSGLVRSLGSRGEGVIAVRYQGVVAVSRLFTPYAQDVSEKLYTSFEPKNYIDKLVLEKWRRLGIAPSATASDAQFVRRAYLDAIGVLPTPDEVRAFLTDAADKRDKLVDRLVDRPEYATYWAQQWGDLLRNKQGDGAQKSNSVAFANWLHDAFAQNMHFDRFARDLIAVTGTIEEHPQMDWYRQLNSMQNRVEDTAQVFLGMRVSCANCHNHPFQHISQNDYWRFAAYFARVDAMTYGTVKTVKVKDDGAVTNPRTGAEMTPKPFGGAEYKYVKGEDPRQKLVDWIVAKENPYFSRAIANRIWAHFLNRGCYEAVDDLRDTNPPSNPALLEALAADLAEHEYDLKYLIKLIMKSRVYGLSSEPISENVADRLNYARHYPQRLSATVLLDAISSATGVPAEFKDFPQAKRAIELPNEAQQNDFLDIFGRSHRETPCVCETRIEPNLAQVLFLMFAPELQDEIAKPQGVVAKLVSAKKPTNELVTDLYLRTVSRPPSDEELKDAVALVDGDGQRQAAVEDLLWTLLNSKEFLFNH